MKLSKNAKLLIFGIVLISAISFSIYYYLVMRYYRSDPSKDVMKINFEDWEGGMIGYTISYAGYRQVLFVREIDEGIFQNFDDYGFYKIVTEKENGMTTISLFRNNVIVRRHRIKWRSRNIDIVQ
jgi:hypothetical protein